MSDVVDELVERDYAFGFQSELDTEFAPKGLNEDVVRLISAKNDEPDWLLDWRLGAFRHFLTLDEPTWSTVCPGRHKSGVTMSRIWNPVALTRACTATTVPYGDAVVLDEGGLVGIVQQLGGSITVRTEIGTLLRIDGADADALGLELDVSDNVADGPFEIAHVIDALQGIYDPEIPVSIVELGLVYRCEEIIGADGTRRIEIDMSMTAPGCGMGDILRDDALSAVRAVPGVDDVYVTLVWDPPWTVRRMSEAARLELGLL